MSTLFSPARIGPHQLSHRVVMAPLTRMRSDPGDVPSNLMVEYYSQRASKGGLIISEGTPVSSRQWYAGAPGIYLDNQIAGWHRVTDAAHAKGGRIFLQTTFGHVVTELDRLGIAYLHVVEPRIKGIEEIAKGQDPIAARHLRPKFSRTLIAAGAFTGESAEAIIAAGNADLVAFGRYFISNPDLPERLRRKLPLTRYDRSTFYGGDGRGYIDYPVCAELALAAG